MNLSDASLLRDTFNWIWVTQAYYETHSTEFEWHKLTMRHIQLNLSDTSLLWDTFNWIWVTQAYYETHSTEFKWHSNPIKLLSVTVVSINVMFMLVEYSLLKASSSNCLLLL